MVSREPLEREERGAADGRALVAEAAPEQLSLRAEAEAADRLVGDSAVAEVGGTRGRLELVVPLRPQRGERPLVARLGERVGLRRCLGERQS
jgi:hypothetical protein